MERAPRDWFPLEVALLAAVLVAGAGLRYWLSTALPFDETELELLADASVPARHLRVPFVMLNGASLFLAYLLARRSAGVAAAFTLLLLLQTSLTFQEAALRIRLAPALALVALVAATYARFAAPPWRLPARHARLLVGVCGLLLVRGLVLVVGLPARLERIERESAADPAALLASVEASGAAAVCSLSAFAASQPRWPALRSLDQQEALLRLRQRIGPRASALDGRAPAPRKPGSAVFVPEAAAFLAVPDDLLELTVRVARP